jgi:hypothetical protein
MRLNSRGRDHEGENKAHDATAAGGSGQYRSAVLTQPEEGKEQEFERASGTTEYSCAYARRVLRQHGQRMKPGKQSLVVDVPLRSKRCRAPCYDEKVKVEPTASYCVPLRERAFSARR